VTLSLSSDTATGASVDEADITSVDFLANNGIVHKINGVLVPKALAGEEEDDSETASESDVAADEPSQSSETVDEIAISNNELETAPPTVAATDTNKTIVEIASGASGFSTLVSLLLLADESIVETLSSPGNYTVFAPVNSAFEELLEILDIDMDDLQTLEEKNGFLSRILSYHVVEGSYEASDIIDGLQLTTLQGEDVTLTLTDESVTGVAVNGADVLVADVMATNGVIHAIDGVLIAPSEDGPGTSIDDDNDLTSLLYAFYGGGVVLILGSILAAVRGSA